MTLEENAMERKAYLPIMMGACLVTLAFVLVACGGTPTASPTEPEAAPPTEAPTEAPVDESGAAAYAVNLIAAWVNAGAPDTDAFD